MGTRADFYVGQGEQAEWIGSIALDGHPNPKNAPVFAATTEAQYRQAVTEYLKAHEKYATLPEQGWPWPWETSNATDYAYAFFDGAVHASNYGAGWFDPSQPEPERQQQGSVKFPRKENHAPHKNGKPLATHHADSQRTRAGREGPGQQVHGDRRRRNR